jgi:hypothetical protein
MTHISEIIEDILVEWAYRVHDGMPNPKNTEHIQQLRESMEELNLPNNVIYQVIQNLINEQDDEEEKVTFKHDGETRTITRKTARQYASDIKQGDDSEEKKAAVAAAGFGDKDTKQDKEDDSGKLKPSDLGDTEKYMTGKSDDKDKKDSEDKPKSKADSQREKIGGKVYSEPLETNDKDFYEKNTKNKTTDTFTMPDGVKNNPKIPKKYTQFIERLMNTRLTDKNKGFTADGDTSKSGYYGMGKVGAGNASANAGELLSMMATTMKRDERAEFFRAVDEQIQKAKARGEKIPVTSTWSKAAKANSSAILRMMYDTHGPDYEIVGSAWDIQEEFEALGQDYGEKGYSTDIMFTVKVGDKIVKDEISLKQSLKGQRLLNKTIGSVFEDTGILPQHLQQKGVSAFKDNQIKNIDNFYQNNRMNISEYLNNIDGIENFDKVLLKVAVDMDRATKNKTIESFEGFISQYKKDLAENPNLVLSRDYIKENLKKWADKSDKRAIDKVSITLGRLMTEAGDPLGVEFVEQQKLIAKEHAKEVATFIQNDDKAKEVVMNVVRDNFPLKSVSEGDENIILGEFVISKKVMEGIFGTSDWNQVVESLEVNPDANPPMIEYRAKVAGQDKVIPITEVGIREDGEGYGGLHKFEMKVAENFGKNVESVSRDIYGDQEPIKFPNTPAADLRR